VDIAKAATSAINIALNEIRHRARLERSFEADLHALGREGPFVQMLVNLLVNAAHAIPALDGATHVITVSSAALSESRAVLEVSDTGVGVAPSALAHVFDPFSTSKRRGEGSGLGLAISKRIVEGFGGQISIRSRLGEGTTVRIELPRAPCDCSDREVSAVSRERHSADRPKPRLLIVDDELTVGPQARAHAVRDHPGRRPQPGAGGASSRTQLRCDPVRLDDAWRNWAGGLSRRLFRASGAPVAFRVHDWRSVRGLGARVFGAHPLSHSHQAI
jgi:hypothetical protein